MDCTLTISDSVLEKQGKSNSCKIECNLMLAHWKYMSWCHSVVEFLIGGSIPAGSPAQEFLKTGNQCQISLSALFIDFLLFIDQGYYT